MARSLGLFFDKRVDRAQSKTDQDVMDLESLRRNANTETQEKQREKLATLELQLAVAAAAPVSANLGQREHGEEYAENIGKVEAETEANKEPANDFKINNVNNNLNINGDKLHSPPAKQYHGAARLAFGQNPETNAQYLFKHSGGQYSALDMAQYVFWTGDEEGVAKAVEEFIRKGLMSRENAIKFLRDISMGIDYLENAYSVNKQIDQIDDNSIRNYPQLITTTTTTTTQKPIFVVAKTVNQEYSALLPSLMKLNEIAHEKNTNKENAIDFDESSGRLRLAEFLHAEYSLEEVIYQLAKVMFSQSLSKGSEEAQVALQRLTTFLETEETSGRISPSLQKKVLDILLVALSDCLAEHPQLLPAARLSMGETIDRLPKHQDKH